MTVPSRVITELPGANNENPRFSFTFRRFFLSFSNPSIGETRIRDRRDLHRLHCNAESRSFQGVGFSDGEKRGTGRRVNESAIASSRGRGARKEGMNMKLIVFCQAQPGATPCIYMRSLESLCSLSVVFSLDVLQPFPSSFSSSPFLPFCSCPLLLHPVDNNGQRAVSRYCSSISDTQRLVEIAFSHLRGYHCVSRPFGFDTLFFKFNRRFDGFIDVAATARYFTLACSFHGAKQREREIGK